MCTTDKIKYAILNNMFVTCPLILIFYTVIVLFLLGSSILVGIITSLAIYPQYDIRTGCIKNSTSNSILDTLLESPFNYTESNNNTYFCSISNHSNSNICYLDTKYGIISGCALAGAITIVIICYIVGFIRTIIRSCLRGYRLRSARIPYFEIAKQLANLDSLQPDDKNDHDHFDGFGRPDYMDTDSCDFLVISSIVVAVGFVIVCLTLTAIGILLTLMLYGAHYDIKKSNELFCNTSSNFNIFGKCPLIGSIPLGIAVLSILIIMCWQKIKELNLIERLYSNYEINHSVQ